MSRYLSLLAFVALPALLAACDAPKSPLAKAKPGECYTVVGLDSLGKPTLAKTPCAASSGAVLAAACPPPVTMAPPGCPPAGTAKPATALSSVGQTSRAVSNRLAVRSGGVSHPIALPAFTRARATSYANRGAQYGSRSTQAFGDYDRVYTPSSQPLYGAPQKQEFHAEGGYQRGESHGYQENHRGHAYAPPPPTHGRAYAYREERREHYAPPPVIDHGYREERYVEHGAPRHKGSAVVGRSERRSQSSSSYSESSSSSSSYSASGSGHGSGPCCVSGGGHGTLPPSPFDRDGYLTWRGKTPG